MVAIAASAAQRPDVVAAKQDQASLPAESQPYVFYFTTAHLTQQEREDCLIALDFVMCSTSMQPVVEHCRPVKISETCFRVDLRDLGWAYADWLEVTKRYPYQRVTTATPLLVRADWFVVAATDCQESDTYYRLLFGGKNIPETRDDWLKLLDVSTTAGLDDKHYNFGIIEGRSGVSKQLVRWIENRPVQRGYAWGTRDVLALKTDTDPLEHLDGSFAHDGEEWIVGVMKRSTTSGQTGMLQVYLLSAGDGKRVDRAPVDLVEDSTRFRGLAEIRNAGSCIQCHDTGLNSFTKHEFRDLVRSGVETYTKDKAKQQAIEAFHLADLSRELERNNEDFSTGVLMATGYEPKEAVAAYKRTVDEYDDELTLIGAANELYVAPETLKAALARQSLNGNNLGARVAGLAHGGTITRKAWEQRYHEVRAYVHAQ